MKTLLTKHSTFFFLTLVIMSILVFMVARQEIILQSDHVVILKTRPVDPRDLFRGEYVILRYEIEQNDKVQDIVIENDLTDGQEIFLGLEEDSKTKLYSVVQVALSLPADDDLWIKGEVWGSSVRFSNLEQYFVPEGSGRAIEEMGSDIHAEIALKNGNARIIRLLDKDLESIDPRDFLSH